MGISSGHIEWARPRKGSDMTQGEPDAEPSAIVRHLRMIKAAAIIMGVLIIVLTAVVIGTIASRLAKMGAPPVEMSI